MLTNETRRELLNRAKSSGFPGSITEVFQAADQGIDLIEQHQMQQQQEQEMQVANTPQQQETGLREQHAMGNTQASMAFPDVQPNQSFNTIGMKAPIDIQKIDDQGHLVESYKNVPPGIQDLPTGPSEGTIIESPAAYQKGGFEKNSSDARDALDRGMTLVSSKRGSDDTHGDYTYYIYKNASRGSSSNFRIYDTDPTKGGFSRQDSLNIYNNQEELNKLAESINSRVQARNENANDDWDLFMQNKNEIGDLYSEYDKKRFENYKEYYEQGQDLKDNPFFLEGYTGEGALVWYGEENIKGEYVPSEKEGEYVGNTPELNKYKPVKPSELKVKKKEIKKKKEKLLKIDPIPLQPLPTDDSLPEPVKAPPYKLIKNKSNYYTTERVGIGTHTYPKGDDNKPLVRLKDEAGRTIFTGSQTEYTEKYGNYLKRGTTEYGKRKKSRLYLKNKKQTGGVKETPAQYNARIKTEYEANMLLIKIELRLIGL